MIPGLGAQTISPFPNPPDFAQNYTNERISHGTAPLPPAPLTEFVVFGEEYRLSDEVIAPLPSLGIDELYTDKLNWKVEMKKLLRSIVAAFLDLIEILICCPQKEERADKLCDIHTMFINMHHLINEYRPYQARHTLKLLQIQQLEQLEETVDRFSEYLEDGREELAEHFQSININLDPPPIPDPITGVRIEANGEVRFKELEEVANDHNEDEEMEDIDPDEESSCMDLRETINDRSSRLNESMLCHFREREDHERDSMSRL